MRRERPPFTVVPGQSPAEAADEIVGVCNAVGTLADKMQWVERETLRRIAVDRDPAMAAAARASRAIAEAVDADAGSADRNGYHNRQHLCEVTLVACFLARLHRLTPRDAQRLLLAALIHDLDHDGLPGADFRPERRSLARAVPFLRDAGVGDGEIGRLAALVLATEPVTGTRRALEAVAAHAGGSGASGPSALAPELDALDRDASLAHLAVLLCEADLLPSIGLTPVHGLALQRRLADEWRRPLGRDDKRRFIDRVLASGIVGDFFRPNVLAFKALLEARDDGPTEG